MATNVINRAVNYVHANVVHHHVACSVCTDSRRIPTVVMFANAIGHLLLRELRAAREFHVKEIVYAILTYNCVKK